MATHRVRGGEQIKLKIETPILYFNPLLIQLKSWILKIASQLKKKCKAILSELVLEVQFVIPDFKKEAGNRLPVILMYTWNKCSY